MLSVCLRKVWPGREVLVREDSNRGRRSRRLQMPGCRDRRAPRNPDLSLDAATGATPSRSTVGRPQAATSDPRRLQHHDHRNHDRRRRHHPRPPAKPNDRRILADRHPPRTDHVNHALLAVSVILVVLAAIKALFITWSAAIDARPQLTIARALGDTRTDQRRPDNSAAHPRLPGIILGIPAGIALVAALSHGYNTTAPSAWSLTRSSSEPSSQSPRSAPSQPGSAPADQAPKSSKQSSHPGGCAACFSLRADLGSSAPGFGHTI